MIDHAALLRRRGELVRSLGNAVMNMRQAERELAEHRDAEQRVRGAITFCDEMIELVAPKPQIVRAAQVEEPSS